MPDLLELANDCAQDPSLRYPMSSPRVHLWEHQILGQIGSDHEKQRLTSAASWPILPLTVSRGAWVDDAAQALGVTLQAFPEQPPHSHAA
jgi:hypothetical protein